MAIPEKLEEILALAAKATEEHRVNWTRGPSPEMFFLALNEFTVQITRKLVPPKRISIHARGPGQYFDAPLLSISFITLDSRGEEIDGVMVNQTDPEFERLQSLFDMARRSATDVNEKLTRLKEQLVEKSRG